MPLRATVESLDAVDEQYRGLYKQTDKGFRLDAEGVEFEEDVAGLKSALERERSEKKAAEKRLKALPADFDPEKWAELTEREKKAAEEQAKKEGQWENWKAQLQEQHAKDLAGKEERIGALTKRVEGLLITGVAAQEIAKLEGNAKLLMPHVERMTRVVEEDGDFVARVIDEKGDVRLGKSGEPMTISELVSELRESDDYAAAFKGSGAAGGGAPGRGAAGGGVRSKYRTRADFGTVAERVAFIGEHGQEAYLALPQS